MSSNYAVVGLAMGAAGVLIDTIGARTLWVGAGVLFIVASFVALVMTRWLPVAQGEEWEAVEASSESAAALLGNGFAPHTEPALESANGRSAPPLERIASLLEEIEARRDAESRKAT
jgi:hypothetical protein